MTDELDAELRRLFDDNRLDVRLREGAQDAVVAGARRIRRRRAVLASTGGVLTALVLVTGSLVLGGLRGGSNEAAPPPVADRTYQDSGSPSMIQPPPQAAGSTAASSNTDQATTPSSVPRPSTHRSGPSSSSLPTMAPNAYGSVLGPTGYATLRLGMSFDDAKATGMLAQEDTAPASCTEYKLTEGSAAVSNVYISPSDGILRFTAGRSAHTPEGIKIGSTLAELRAAYRDLSKGSSGYTASNGSGGSYVFYVDGTNVLTSFQLIGPAVNC